MEVKKYVRRMLAVILSVLCIMMNGNFGVAFYALAEEEVNVTDSSTAPEGYVPQESMEEMTAFSLNRNTEDLSSVNVLLVEDTLP